MELRSRYKKLDDEYFLITKFWGVIGPKIHKSNNLEHCLILDGCSVDSSSLVRNLDVIFDSNLSFDSHVSSICKTEFFILKMYLNWDLSFQYQMQKC